MIEVMAADNNRIRRYTYRYSLNGQQISNFLVFNYNIIIAVD